ncbi:MAG: PHP domain-containing protein [Bryobacterales bacterium]|nr:PHP domain-containing protein [Bryobacterales bacterium]
MIDLHAHSTESDGSLTPEELVRAARDAGLEALAITDHDTLGGYVCARATASELGLELVCGVEITASYRALPRHNGAHLLAYFPLEPPGEEFRQWLLESQSRRQRRNERLANRLRELGLEVDLSEVSVVARRLVGRVHFARVLVNKGYVRSVSEAFALYLGEGGKAHVPLENVSLEEAITRVNAAGGLACIAHPGRLKWSLREHLAELCAMGLAGLEVYSSEHSAEQTELFRRMAESWGLVVTGGSDFHGDGRPDVRLGTGRDGNLAVPRSVLEGLRAAASVRSR